MKLKPGFITQEINHTQFLVPMEEGSFSGVVRSNETAAYVINLLREETTEEKIVNAMYEKYDASKEQIVSDVGKILSVLREIHALDEDARW